MTNTPEQTLSDLLAATDVLWKLSMLSDRYANDGEFSDAVDSAFHASKNALPALREYMEEVKGLRRVLLRVIEAAERALGDHEAPGDCFATGPLTGNAFADLVSCPGCVQINEIAEARAALSRLGGK